MVPLTAIGQTTMPTSSSLSAAEITLGRTQTETIKALSKKIDELEARVKDLESRIVAKR